jgi:hypothetical protein
MTAAPPDPVFNPDARIEVLRAGNTQEAIIVIDDVLLNPDSLIEYAAQARFALPPATSRYPGLVAQLPDSYRVSLAEVLRGLMARTFDTHPQFRPTNYGFFGLATVQPQAMTPAQAAPHIDSHRLNSFATVHYLSPTLYGGTAFFRHKATGHEVITPIRSDGYRRLRRQELEERKDQQLDAVRDLYDEIAHVDAAFNRLIFYRAGLFHSARLENASGLTDDPRTGRLTANMFFNTEGL